MFISARSARGLSPECDERRRLMTERSKPLLMARPPAFHTMPQSPAVPVVCAVLEDAAGRVLVAQRPAHKHLALKWEFPGGKIEPDETSEAALVREIHEELRCDIVVLRALPRFTHDYGEVVIEMSPFVCTLAPQSPPPHPHEHVAIRWVNLSELPLLDLAAADLPVVASLRSSRTGF